jgi:hypothetical protein
MQALTTATENEIFVKVYGKTLTLVDIKYAPKFLPMDELSLKRYPNPVKVGINGKIWWDEGVAFATEEDVKKLGGDFDGDQGEIKYRCNDSMVIDTKEYKGVLPDKAEADDNGIPDIYVWIDIVLSINKVGSIHNESAALVSLFRYLGITDEQAIEMAYDLIWHDEKVIQTFKHANDTEPIKKIEDRAKDWRDKFGIEIDDKTLTDKLMRELECSQIVRNSMLNKWIEAANGSICPNPDGPFFEKWLSHFKWIINIPKINPKKFERQEAVRKNGFKWLKAKTNQIDSDCPTFTENDMEMRWEWSKERLNGIEEAKLFILNLFMKRDYDFANYCYDKYWGYMKTVLNLEGTE